MMVYREVVPGIIMDGDKLWVWILNTATECDVWGRHPSSMDAEFRLIINR